jgi:hypothetical protein
MAKKVDKLEKGKKAHRIELRKIKRAALRLRRIYNAFIRISYPGWLRRKAIKIRMHRHYSATYKALEAMAKAKLSYVST